jgi:hypothetical protein
MGDGGGDGGDNESAPDIFGGAEDRTAGFAAESAAGARDGGGQGQGGGTRFVAPTVTTDTGGGGGGSMIDPNLLAAINAAASQFGIQTDAEGKFTGFQPVAFQDFGALSEVAGEQLAFGRGEGVDPRLSAIETGQTQTRQLQSEFFGRRRGGIGSAAELNAQNRLERNLAADKALQLFTARQGALQFGTGLTQQIAEAANRRKQLELATTSAGIELLSLPTQLDIAETAAENMGEVGGDGGGGGGLFGK